MATKLFSIAPGASEFSVTEATGSPTVTASIELTVDVATNLVNTASGTRGLKKSEIIDALKKLENYILKSTTIPN